MFPTSNVFLIFSNILKSLICSLIIKAGNTPYFNFNLVSRIINIEKQPSASANPVINQEFNLDTGRLIKVEKNLLFNCNKNY